MVLNSLAPDMVEVAVRQVGVVERVNDTESHRVMSLQGDGLAPDQQGEMISLLQRYTKVFSNHDEDFGRTGMVRHQIPTVAAPPSHERYCPVPPSLCAE